MAWGYHPLAAQDLIAGQQDCQARALPLHHTARVRQKILLGVGGQHGKGGGEGKGGRRTKFHDIGWRIEGVGMWVWWGEGGTPLFPPLLRVSVRYIPTFSCEEVIGFQYPPDVLWGRGYIGMRRSVANILSVSVTTVYSWLFT